MLKSYDVRSSVALHSTLGFLGSKTEHLSYSLSPIMADMLSHMGMILKTLKPPPQKRLTSAPAALQYAVLLHCFCVF